MGKQRLDTLLVERGLFSSREQAKRAVMAGEIFVDGQLEDKPGTQIDAGKITSIETRGEKMPFVSRGGYKLLGAIEAFDLTLKDRVCLDIGASTGGFTDCMLQHGAAKVYAVDVGTAQLDWSLRNNENVVVMEKTNFRTVDTTLFPEAVAFATADVSFISLDKILLPAAKVLATGGEMVCLVKPQFEAGRDRVGKGGLVKDPAVHEEVLAYICDYARLLLLDVCGMTNSPVRGTKGNIEYLLYLKKTNEKLPFTTEEEALGALRMAQKSVSQEGSLPEIIRQCVLTAHAAFSQEGGFV